MNSDVDLDKLIILNLEDLDAVAKRIEPLTKRVWTRIADQLRDWATDQGWHYELDPDGDYKVCPPEWLEGGEPIAWFVVGWGPGDNEDGSEGQPYFGLSRLAGVAGGRFCLWLGQDTIKRIPWRNALRSAAERGDLSGFALDDKDGPYIDCTPPVEALADAVFEDDFKIALIPLVAALQCAHRSWRTLDAFVRSGGS